MRLQVSNLQTAPHPGPLSQRKGGLENRGAVRFSLATPADDADIRRLLRENPMGQEVSLSLEREPDSSLADSIEGDVSHTLVARDAATGRLAAVGGVCVRDAYINGDPVRLGYLGRLRVDRAYRHRMSIIRGGYQFLRELHPSLGVKLYLTSIFSDNAPARRLLERALPGMPTYRPLGSFDTLLLTTPVAALTRILFPRAKGRGEVQIRRGTLEYLDDIVCCLSRNGPRFQFAPIWTREDLLSADRGRNLRPDDFLLALRNGRAVGCLAIWDQRPFKQAVVRGYATRLGRWRPLINLLGPLVGVPRLPATGQPLQIGYVSHVAVDGDDPAVFSSLMRTALASARRRGLRHLAVGFAARHPLLAVTRRLFRHRSSAATLYDVHWEDGADAFAALEGRPPHYEVALL